MGKNLQDKPPSDASGNQHPGCVWGILHIMKYHHWHYVKKRFMYKRRGNNKNGTGVGNHGNCGDACGVVRNVDNDAKMDKTTTADEENMNHESTPTAKTSVKARIKARIAEEMSKKRGRHNRNSSCPIRSQLTRTESIHHFEPPSNMDPIAEMVLNEASPRIVAHENNESSSYEKPSNNSNNNNGAESSPISIYGDSTVDHDQVNENQKDHTLSQEQLDNDAMQNMLEKKLIHVKEFDADSSVHHPKEYLEALDIINVNKELLVKILHDPGSPLAQQFQNQQAVSAKLSLTKSESFPMPSLSGKGGSEPTKLKPKHELKDGSPAQKPTWSTSLKYASERPMPSITTDYNVDSSSSPCHPSLKSQGENPVAIKRFKDLRQKIKHVIKEESKQERHVISMEAILHKIPHGRKLTKELEKEIVSHSKDPALHREGKDSPRSSYGSDHSVSPLKKNKMRHMSRTSSFDASLDRYRRLYETTSFNKEAKYHSSSERLKVRTEESGSPFQSSTFRKVPKGLGRIFSLPDMESYYQSEESPDGFPTGALFKTCVDGNASRKSRFGEQKRDLSIGSENELQLDFPKESEVRENLDDATETNAVTRDKVESTSSAHDETSSKVGLAVDKLEILAAGYSVSHKEQDTEPRIEAVTNVADSVNSPRDISSPRKCSQSEGEELKIIEDGPDSLDNKEGMEPDIDTANVVGSGFDTEEVETPTKHSSYDLTHVQVNERDMTEFSYVRDVLEFSGFSGNECLGTWHADDPPVYPLVYEGAEGCFVLDPDCAGNEEDGECDHLLLFDLINEVLMEIYGRSYNYCPRALSSLCYIRLMPAGHHVLKEVWALISWYLSLRPEVDQSLDYVVSNDLAKNDGWMNLQFDSECIGIELEDLIFDELLGEAICD